MQETCTQPRWPWPLDALPLVRVAGRFLLDDRDFEHKYGLGETHALHLYGYHGRMRLGGQLLELQPGDVTLTPLGVQSSYDVDAAGYHLCIHFGSGAEAREDDAPDTRRPHVVLPLHWRLGAVREAVATRMLAVAAHHAESAASPVAQAAASAGMLELLLWLGTRGGSADGTDKRGAASERGGRAVAAAERAAAYVDAHLGETLTVPTIAEAAGLSQNYLARAFRSRFGVTLPRYLLSRRIEMARHLLGTTDLPVGTIAARVGMADPHHFNKQFRRLTGQSPTAARAAALTNRRNWSKRLHVANYRLEEADPKTQWP